MIVDDDTAALAQLQFAGTTQGILRTDTSGKDNQVRFKMLVFTKHHTVFAAFAINNLLSASAGMHSHTQFLNFVFQQTTTEIIHLNGHQARGKFHHMGFQTQIV